MSTKQGVVVGIDLGTTMSLVSVMQDGKPLVLENAIGELLTPSAVSVDADGTVLVGAAARARVTTHPELTAVAFKRDMGTDKVYDLGGRRMTPQDLSAMLLGALKRDAEAALGQTVVEAVVTVPAYFGDHQRQATRDAAAIAGLKAERIVNEPTAAAMAYGLHNLDKELKAVVLDLGGGTFDVTVLEIIEGVIEIQASAGDSRLGGEDFADQLAEMIEQRILEERGTKLTGLTRSKARVREACEDAKRRLTDGEETRVVLPGLSIGDAGTIDYEATITRDQAEACWVVLLERLRGPILRALRDADMKPADVDEVLLVGGATRMPCIVRLAAQVFGRMPQRHLPPDEAVCMGAAIQAALKHGDAAVDDLVVTDVAPFTLGIESLVRMGRQSVGGVFTPILERGTVIPASRVKSFQTVDDNQSVINIEVFQGEHSLCKDNKKLGSYQIKGIPNNPAGHEAVDVRFTYDLNGILEVETTVTSTQKKGAVVLEQTPGRLSDEQIKAAREAMKKIKFHPRDSLPNRTALERADALYTELTGDARDQLGHTIGQLRAAMEMQDDNLIRDMRESLNSLVMSYRHQNR